MKFKSKIYTFFQSSRFPVLFILISLVLLVLVLRFSAAYSIDHTLATAAELLSDKGAAMIHIFERHFCMASPDSSRMNLQHTFEALQGRHDIVFAAVINLDGTITAYSDPGMVGKTLFVNGKKLNAERLSGLHLENEVNWSIIKVNGERVFAVYRYFSPYGMKAAPDENSSVIILGLDFMAYEEIHAQARGTAFLQVSFILLVAVGCSFIVWLAFRVRESRIKREAAEIKVRRLEEEVSRKEKLAAIGSLASGVAHEIRNPLSSITGYAYYFSQFFSEGSEERKYAETMVKEVQRLNRVISDLLCFAKPAGVILKYCNVVAIVEHSISLLSQDARKLGIKITFDKPDKFPLAMLDADRFTQALLNVCINAIDAMPEGGALSFALTHLNKEFFTLEVRDTGEGISKENISRVFDLYYTTKGQGSGLGLPTVYKLIEAMGGQVAIDSGAEPEGGTIFRFIMPFGLSASK